MHQMYYVVLAVKNVDVQLFIVYFQLVSVPMETADEVSLMCTVNSDMSVEPLYTGLVGCRGYLV